MLEDISFSLKTGINIWIFSPLNFLSFFFLMGKHFSLTTFYKKIHMTYNSFYSLEINLKTKKYRHICLNLKIKTWQCFELQSRFSSYLPFFLPHFSNSSKWSIDFSFLSHIFYCVLFKDIMLSFRLYRVLLLFVAPIKSMSDKALQSDLAVKLLAPTSIGRDKRSNHYFNIAPINPHISIFFRGPPP